MEKKDKKQRDIVLSQDNALTTARYKFDLIEKRALYSIIRNIRAQYIENENGRRDLFDDLIITIHEEELKKCGDNTKMQNIYDALKRLRNRDIEINNEKMWLSIGFVNYVKHIKNKSYFEVQVSKEVLPYYVELAQNFTSYSMTVAIALKSTFSQRFYELCCQYRNAGFFFYTVEKLRELNVWIDTGNFDKIILNILSNAFKFTPEKGNIDITIRTGEDNTLPDPLKQYAEIIIADTGTGIDEQEKEHIFERFYQIRNSQQNPKGGTGIGLHLTRSLVELHHGIIYVENNKEQPGCRFIIRLPLGNKHLRPEEVDNNEQKVTVAVPTVPVISPIIENEEEKKVRVKTKYHVLIVEDDEEIRNYIAKEFGDKFHIMESRNGKEALEQIFKKTPDLVISDIMMPEMDGFTLCRKIKQNVNLNHIPVILLTAKTREEDNLEGLNTGADAYIMKPFNIEILQKTVENLINTRQQLRKVFTGQQNLENKVQKLEVKSPDEKLMERIMKVINENIGNPNLTIETITTEVGISRVHLHRKLKELTNQTTRDFIRNIRLKEAARLLSEKQHTISEIAMLTGFTDPNNFSTTFKELYGMPPSMYMKEQLSKKEE